MRINPLVLAAAVSTLAFAEDAPAQSASPGLTPKQVLDMAAANDITDVQEFWFNPHGGWTGVEGFTPKGEWHSLVIDDKGKVVRSGADSGAKPSVSIGAAADAALKNGVAKLRGIWQRDGNWIVVGWDAAEKEVVLMVDGIKGEVKKFGG
jgi:hypothetical protein